MMSATKDFGSYSASTVHKLLNIPEDEYIPPALPFPCDTFDTYSTTPPQFGHNIKKKHFLLEEDCIFLNHGSCGAVLKDGLETAQKYQLLAERQPMRFYDRVFVPKIVHVTRRLAKFVDCDASDIVLMDNATTALNTVIQGIPLTPGDTVFCLSLAYGPVMKILQKVCDSSGATLQVVTVNIPVKSQQELISYVEDNLKPGTKFAVIDHIPSSTPFIMPLEEIIHICRQRNVLVIVDGAHGLGSLPLSISSLDPDFYITNGHKWLCCMNGVALMYVKKELQKDTRTLIISHGYGTGFSSEFLWQGLRDASAFLSVNAILDFWETLGSDRIQQYMYDLCRQAANMLVEAWDTYLAAPSDMFGSMSLIKLPESVIPDKTERDFQDAETVQDILFHQYNIEIPIKCVQGKLYVRISAHIYNEMLEYEALRDAILEIASKSQ